MRSARRPSVWRYSAFPQAPARVPRPPADRCVGRRRCKATGVPKKVIRADDGSPLESVNIVNLNQVIGTSTDGIGDFEIKANVNDTLHLSYLGFKSIKVRVTNDWIVFGAATSIEMTELALALEKVVVNQLRLTGYLEIDIQQIPLRRDTRYSISGLPSSGYEGRTNSPSMVSKVLGAIFNPADFLHNLFGKKPREMRKLRKMKEDDEIRNLLASRFDPPGRHLDMAYDAQSE